MKPQKPESLLGKAIRAERTQRGFSQERLALECDLHRTYVGSVERGERNISLRNILAIAKVLNLPASKLLEKAGL